MNIELSISDAAKEDMEDARAWYEDRQSGLGIDFLIALSAVLEKIEENPKQYAVRFGLVRAAPVRKFPYFVYYRYQKPHVMIIAVGHTSQNPKAWQKR